ncbi:MAG: prepilin-type N-terminal cleavage/methylation protein, partial [Oscillospiraceae bacterium]|nr:prepilin-type N-terminal cleavage/methylation protein [Oscillospiraceae bacterium]
NEAKMVGDNIYNWVSEQIVYATDLQIIEEDDSHETPQYSNIIRFQDGELRYKTATKAEYNLFGEGYYAHSDIKMTVKAYNKHMISIKIEVLKNREVLYQTGSSMKVLNIQLKDGAIKGMVGTELVNPKLVFSSTKDAA